MQEELPMLYNQYKSPSPHVFMSTTSNSGKGLTYKWRKQDSPFMPLNVEAPDCGESAKNCRFGTRNHLLSRNLPAIRQDESYYWCPEDYKVQVSFDLQGTQFTPSEYKPYSQKWEDVASSCSNRKIHSSAGTSHSPTLSPETKQATTAKWISRRKSSAPSRCSKESWPGADGINLYSKELEK